MNEIEKEIEELARELTAYEWKLCDRLPKNKCLLTSTIHAQVSCDYCKIAEFLINIGYRQVKDKVVLSKEEWKTVCDNLSNAESQGRKINDIYGQCLIENQILKEELRQASELKAETIKLAKQQTARDILQRGKLCMPSGLREWISKQYGVEVE